MVKGRPRGCLDMRPLKLDYMWAIGGIRKRIGDGCLVLAAAAQLVQAIKHTPDTASARVKFSASPVRDLATGVNAWSFRKTTEGGVAEEAPEPAGHHSKIDQARTMNSNRTNGR